jgi:CheY-like chemotaxis protein
MPQIGSNLSSYLNSPIKWLGVLDGLCAARSSWVALPGVPISIKQSSKRCASFRVKEDTGMALVLCTGVNEILVETRKLVLEKSGHKVIAATTEQAMIEACQQHAFNVAVIGQTTSRRDKRRFLALIREYCPSAKVLELYQPHVGRMLESADDWLPVPAAIPQQLVERVAALAKS